MRTIIMPLSLATLLLLVGSIAILGGCSIEEPERTKKFLDWGTPPEVDLRAPWPYAPPEEIQDFVNRVDAIAIATVSAISDPIEEGPYRLPGVPSPPSQPGFPDPTIMVTYYTLNLEQILLDDGNISDNPNLRQSGAHYAGSPQIGRRYLFGMRVNPDGRSYGAPREWNIIPLDSGSIHNIDGTEPGYVGVTDEVSLKEAIESAIPGRVRLQPDQWPKVPVDENAPDETPQGPGGDSDDGPAGNTNQ